MRVDDCGWAMREAGFLLCTTSSPKKRKPHRGMNGDAESEERDGESEETFWISREMVENVATEWGVKRMMMEIEYVKL